MDIRLWSPFLDVDKEWRIDFPRDFPRLLDWPMLTGESVEFRPAIDLVKAEGELIAKVELPGIDPSDIEVSMDGDYMTITGEKHADKEESEGDRYIRERSFGRFLRRFRLPQGASADKMSAVYDKGVLTLSITLPEETEPEPHRIPVEVKD
jgi:HSP20 family protein